MITKPKKSITNKLYLNIAGFNIKISVSPQKRVNNGHYPDVNPSELFKGFIIKKPKSVEYEIILRRTLQLITYKKHKNDNNILFYFYKQNKNSIETFIHISSSQLVFIVSVIINGLLAKEGGFMIHASAVSYGKQAILFFGRSGAGKSTIVKLLRKKFTPLADDVIIVKKVKKQYIAYQTFFNDKNDIGQKKKGGYKIAKIFFIKKSKAAQVIKIVNKMVILKKAIPQIIFALNNKGKKRLFRDCQNFVEGYDQFYELIFPKKREEIVNILSGLL